MIIENTKTDFADKIAMEKNNDFFQLTALQINDSIENTNADDK